MPARSTFGSASVIPFSNAQTPYNIQRSLRFNSGDTSRLTRTPGVAGNRTTWTWSGWYKTTGSSSDQYIFVAGSSGTGGALTGLTYNNNQFQLWWNSASGAVALTPLYRDPSAWYHLCLVANVTAGFLTLYVNGIFVGQRSISGNAAVNDTGEHAIGTTINYGFGYLAPLNGYLAEINFIDGQALTPSSFGYTDSTTGVWMPKKYAGEYGTNGFYINFSDNSNTTSGTLGKDYSGKGNDWTPSGFSVGNGPGCDSMLDVPTNWGTDVGAISGTVRGNYCTFNPLAIRYGIATSPTYTNGNLQITSNSNTLSQYAWSSIALPSSGKFYYEVTIAAIGTSSSSVGLIDILLGQNNDFSKSIIYFNDGSKRINNIDTPYGSSWTTNDVIGVAIDLDGQTVTFYKNNSSQGDLSYNASGLVPINLLGISSSSQIINFGQRPFVYAPPSGFKSLCTTNLSAPVIKKPRVHFDAITYNGTGTTFVSPSALAFAPDFVWAKSRSQEVSHVLSDTVRGAGEVLCSNNTRLFSSDAFISNFNQNGFTLNDSITANNSGSTYVAWNWKAGGPSATNTAGSITSTVSVNALAGFSIVSYTGTGANATVGHGLGVAPKMIIVKRRSASSNWSVYHSSLGSGNVIWLNLTNAYNNTTTYWNNTNPTANVFSVGAETDTNANSSTYIAYCFAEVEGYSKFGSYTGNGAADGPFCFTGFRPRWVMTKRSDGGSEYWYLLDAQRDVNNPATKVLVPNISGAEGAYDSTTIDFLSNGFKIRSSGVGINASGSTNIFAAFAESPFNYARAR